MLLLQVLPDVLLRLTGYMVAAVTVFKHKTQFFLKISFSA